MWEDSPEGPQQSGDLGMAEVLTHPIPICRVTCSPHTVISEPCKAKATHRPETAGQYRGLWLGTHAAEAGLAGWPGMGEQPRGQVIGGCPLPQVLRLSWPAVCVC